MKPELSLPPVNFNLNKKFLKDHADVSLNVSAPSELLAALQDGKAPVPAGEMVLGNVKAAVSSGDKAVSFGGGESKGTVSFSGSAEASFSIGVYHDAASALKAIAPAEELATGLPLTDSSPSRYVAVEASYDVNGTAKGSVALGTGVNATFAATGSSKGLFAVLHRFSDTQPALQVFSDTLSSWALPSHIDDKDDLKPGTWLIAEVDGSIGLKMGVTAGYDFSWIQTINNGALKGDIGLRVQLGASATFGFDASGKFAVVIGRETDEAKYRLRLYKMAKKGWNFALSASVGVDAVLPDFLKQDHKPEELVAAIFGLNDNQLLQDVKDVRAFVNSKVSLQEKLAGLLMNLGGKAIEETTGLSEDEIKAAYENGRTKVVDLFDRLEKLEKTAGHDVTSMLLSLTGVDFDSLQADLTRLAAVSSPDGVQELLKGLLSKGGFERTPIGQLIEAAAGTPLKAITENPAAETVHKVAEQALDLLNGKTLQSVLDYIVTKVSLEQVKKIATQTDLDKADNWLKARLAAFLGKQQVLLEDLGKIQAAVKNVFDASDKILKQAIAAAQKHQEFSWSATYTSSTTRTALIDVTFDFSKAQTVGIFRKAVNGQFDELLFNPIDGITIAEAELTHNIQRNVTSQLTMPFGSSSSFVQTVSKSKLRVVEDNGRVLVYTVEAEDEKSEREGFFGARSGRDSTLTIGAALPLGISGGTKVWKDSTFSYAYKMERAVARMRVSQFQTEVGPLIDEYFPSAFAGAHAFPEWVADLDKLLDGVDADSGTHDIGDTRIALTLTAGPEYLHAWTNAPLDNKSRVYMDLSRALQRALKNLVTFFYFSDPSRYNNFNAAAPVVVYSCIPPSTTIKLNGDDLETLNTDRDTHWNQIDGTQLDSMVRSKETLNNLRVQMTAIAGILRGIPELADTASSYDFNQLNYNNIIAAARRRIFAGSPRPEFLSKLVDVEARLVDNAINAGVEMAKFQKNATQNSAKALEQLAKFGKDITETFNSQFGNDVFLTGAARPLGTVLFVEAGKQFDSSLQNAKLAALLNITVIKSGKSVDEMLAGKFVKDDILHEQAFVET